MSLFKRKDKDLTVQIKYASTLVDSSMLPRESYKYKPEWYSSMKYDVGIWDTNVKKCPAVVNGMLAGFTVFLPFDLLVRLTKNSVDFDARREWINNVEVHDNSQVNFAFGNKAILVKILMPYSVFTDPEQEFLYVYPTLQNLAIANEITGPHGIFQFKHNHSINAFMMLQRPTDDSVKEYTIKRGTPLAQYIPLSDRNLKLDIVDTPHWMPAPPTNILGVSTWFDLIKRDRRIEE